jgi:hypothetical protein
MEYVARAYLTIDGTEIDCKSITNKLGLDGHDVVKTMNRRNRAKGFKSGVPTFELSAEVPVPEGGLGVDFHDLLISKKIFTATTEYNDGRSLSYYDCQVHSLEWDAKHGDDVTAKLDIRALDAASDG